MSPMSHQKSDKIRRLRQIDIRILKKGLLINTREDRGFTYFDDFEELHYGTFRNRVSYLKKNELIYKEWNAQQYQLFKVIISTTGLS